MRDYMRGQFDFLGIPAPVRRAAVTLLFRSFDFADSSDLLDAASGLWQLHEREYQHAAVDLLACRKKLLGAKDLPRLIELVQMKSWWDSVDGLAGVIGAVVKREKTAGQRVMDRAVRSKNFWVRRVAMLHQLGWRSETDEVRLFSYAMQLAPESEFFIRKAIGWALRDYAKCAPAAVTAFLKETRDSLSSLTYREAGKHLPKMPPWRR